MCALQEEIFGEYTQPCSSQKHDNVQMSITTIVTFTKMASVKMLQCILLFFLNRGCHIAPRDVF